MPEQKGWFKDVLGERPVEGGHHGSDPKYSHFAEKETSGKNIDWETTAHAGKDSSSSPPQVDWDQIKGLTKPYEAHGHTEMKRFAEHERTESKAEKRAEKEGDF